MLVFKGYFVPAACVREWRAREEFAVGSTPNLAARLQAEVFRRRHLGEIVGLDEDFARERDLARGGSFALRIVGRVALDDVAGGELDLGVDHGAELEALVADKIERVFARGHYVTREEFEVVKEMAAKARAENEALRAELEALKR